MRNELLSRKIIVATTCVAVDARLMGEEGKRPWRKGDTELFEYEHEHEHEGNRRSMGVSYPLMIGRRASWPCHRAVEPLLKSGSRARLSVGA